MDRWPEHRYVGLVLFDIHKETRLDSRVGYSEGITYTFSRTFVGRVEVSSSDLGARPQ
jgi:hypothetical protein